MKSGRNFSEKIRWSQTQKSDLILADRFHSNFLSLLPFPFDNFLAARSAVEWKSPKSSGTVCQVVRLLAVSSGGNSSGRANSNGLRAQFTCHRLNHGANRLRRTLWLRACESYWPGTFIAGPAVPATPFRPARRGARLTCLIIIQVDNFSAYNQSSL